MALNSVVLLMVVFIYSCYFNITTLGEPNFSSDFNIEIISKTNKNIANIQYQFILKILL
jgi:hypothetical protein